MNLSTPRDPARTSSGEPLVQCLDRHLAPPRADALLRAAGQGDRAAFGRLFDATAPVILGCLRQVLQRGAAELVAEDAYVQLWHTAPRFAAQIRSAHAELSVSVHDELIRHGHGQDRPTAAGTRRI